MDYITYLSYGSSIPGQQYAPTVRDQLMTVVFFMAVLGVADVLYFRRKIARWWLLHAFANAIVVLLGLNDLFTVMLNPLIASAGEYCMLPNLMVAAVHLYHITFFRNLPLGDWVHHILFAGVICGSAIALVRVVIFTSIACTNID